jgi:hypothetical protein
MSPAKTGAPAHDRGSPSDTAIVRQDRPPHLERLGKSALGDRSALAARLYPHLVPDPDSGCIFWTGAIRSDGYGQIRVGGRTLFVHRVVWELEKGPIPGGLQLDHVRARGCVHRHCANVAHLELVTSRVNTLRGQSVPAVNAAKTHCAAGHEFDLLNTYWPPGGGRACRICRREHQRDRDRKRRARARAAGEAS